MLKSLFSKIIGGSPKTDSELEAWLNSLSKSDMALISREAFDKKERDFIEMRIGVPINRFSDFSTYMACGYKKVWATFRACKIIASTMMTAHFKIVKNVKTADDVTEKFGSFLKKPNPYDSWEELLEMWSFHMELVGNAYWLKDSMDAYGRPESLYPLLPQFMQVIPDEKKRVNQYIYRVNGKQLIFSPEEIIHFRFTNPNNIIMGMGSIEPSEAIYNEYINKAVLGEKFLENGAQMSGILSRESDIADEDQWRMLKKKFNLEYSGTRNAGKVAFLNGKWSYQKLGMTMQEMQSLEKEKWNIEQIFLNHGVPLSVAGVDGAANYACLPAGELVSTPFGPKAIETLKQGDTIYQFDDRKGTVEVPVEAIIFQGDAEVYEINTDSRSLRASDNHPILCVSRTAGTGNNGKRVSAELVWKNASDVKEDDLVVAFCGANQSGRVKVKVWSSEEDAAYILGQYVGNGSGVNLDRKRVGGVSIACHESHSYQQEVVFALMNGFGVAGTPEKTQIRFNSVELAKDWEKAGFSGCSLTKRIPDWIYSLPRNLQLSFAAGLVDSDGTISKSGKMVYSTPNKAISEGLRHLLIGCGIPVTRLLPCEQETNYGHILNWRFTSGIPSEFNVPVRKPVNKQRLEAARAKNSGFSGIKIPKSYRLPASFSLPVGYTVQKVRSVTKVGVIPVYDLATVGTHTFIASGIVTHNTSKQDEMNFRKYKVVPMLDLLVGKLNADGFFHDRRADIRLTYEMSGLIDVKQIVDEYGPLVDKGAMTLNELREMCNLPIVQNPALDQYYVNTGRVPIEMAGVQTHNQPVTAEPSDTTTVTSTAVKPVVRN